MDILEPKEPDNLQDALIEIARLESRVKALETILSTAVESMQNRDLPSDDRSLL